MNGDSDNVRVALRVRPLVASERERGCKSVVEYTPGAPQVKLNNELFTFNYVFGEHEMQERVYKDAVSEMINKLLNGFNATILAYGQTGSGKTHTMGTAFNGELSENVGVIPRAMHDIFERIAELKHDYDFEVKCSFVELYNEQLLDLLSSAPREQRIVELREDRSGIVMCGITEETVCCARETTECLVRGSQGRAVGSTAMNQQSSRSHAIFTVTLQSTKNDEHKTVMTSKFHLVDLAGSERSKKTQATGERFKEGVNINRGLSVLGNVISALGQGQGSKHVPYRDSKLTRLLQDSLGGNSVTLMIACISPADYNAPESMSTLRYADRARKIKNKPIVNQDPQAAKIKHLNAIIASLQAQLLSVGAQPNVALNAANENLILQPAAVCENCISLQEKYTKQQQQMQLALEDVAESELRAHMAENALEKLQLNNTCVAIRSALGELEFKEMQTPQELQQNSDAVKKALQHIADLENEAESSKIELEELKRGHEQNSINNDSMDEQMDDAVSGVKQEVYALMETQSDIYTSKQMDYKEQIRKIERELSLKVELHQKVVGNLTKLGVDNSNQELEKKYMESEKKIQDLESERNELLDKLHHAKQNNASAKLSEERRKRLQALEQEILEKKRTIVQQSKLLKDREKEKQRVSNLTAEIQKMKEVKVKLIRTMRSEADNFRQWKMQREKELMQLKNKDRKLQNEMARKEALHVKQRNWFMRKCEEVTAANKRLKDAVERQNKAQSYRQKMNMQKEGNAIAARVEHVERELDVVNCLVDAENTLQQLIESRNSLNKRIAKLQQMQSNAKLNPLEEEELHTLQEEQALRNTQICNLQKAYPSTDLSTRINSISETVQSIPEARAVLKRLLKFMAEMRREAATHSHEQHTQMEDAKEQYKNAAKRIRLLEVNNGEVSHERDTYKAQLNELNMKQERKISKAPARFLAPVQELVDTTMTDDEMEESSDDFDARNDPDWVKTPRIRTRKRSRSMKPSENTSGNSNSTFATNSGMEETYVTAQTNTNSLALASGIVNEKKAKEKHCKCRGDCSHNRCGCRTQSKQCSSKCRCTAECMNGKLENIKSESNSFTEMESKDQPLVVSQESMDLETEEQNEDASPPKKQNVTFDRPAVSATPNNRLSTLNFNTPSAKKKFFE